jgi:hypothetical protein
MKDGRRFGRPPNPRRPSTVATGKVNLTDPDSKLVHGMRGWIQGYNAQAACNERHLIVAAEVMTASPDFGHLGPMVDAARRELLGAGVVSKPDVVVTDAGYWHLEQMTRSPPTASRCSSRRTQAADATRAHARAGTAAPTTSCAASSQPNVEACSTASAASSSSLSSPTPNTTAASAAFTAAAGPPRAPNGASWPRPTTSGDETARRGPRRWCPGAELASGAPGLGLSGRT